MSIDEILDMWREDSKVDRLELGEGALRTQELHAKYIDIFFRERVRMLDLKKKYSKLRLLRYEYWMGILPLEDLKEYGWPPQNIKIAKQDIDMYLESDEVLSELKLKIDFKQEIINVLDQILKTISQRGYQINAAINWTKFTAGQ